MFVFISHTINFESFEVQRVLNHFFFYYFTVICRKTTKQEIKQAGDSHIYLLIV